MRLTPQLTRHESPHVVGDIWHWSNVPSAHLSHRRDVVIWLPPGYDNEPQRRYPVLYVQDGQNLFNPATSFAGVAWNLDNAATKMIEQGRIDPCIIVGIYNTPDRLHEYNPLRRRGAQYGRFIVEELIPAIDSHFRTAGGRRNALLGSSMGALISTVLLWWHSDRFFGAAAMSPSYWIFWQAGGPATWFRHQKIVPQQPARLYIDRGTDGPEARTEPFIQEVLVSCRGVGFSDERLMYHIAEGGAHNEASWQDRAHLPLEFLFGTTGS